MIEQYSCCKDLTFFVMLINSIWFMIKDKYINCGKLGLLITDKPGLLNISRRYCICIFHRLRMTVSLNNRLPLVYYFRFIHRNSRIIHLTSINIVFASLLIAKYGILLDLKNNTPGIQSECRPPP